MHTAAIFSAAVFAVVCLAWFGRRILRAALLATHLTAGTVPGQFPQVTNMIQGEIAVASKLGNTGAFTSTVFFTAPVAGYYLLAWAVHINVTDGAGSLTLTVTPPNSVAIPGVQAAPATPSDGKGPAAPYFMAQGATVTAACAVSGLTGTNYDVWVFAQKLN